jgi:dihydrodipicolinate reductase
MNFSMSRKLNVKSTVLPLRNIHKYLWTSTEKKTNNETDRILIEKRRNSNTVNAHSFRGPDCGTEHFSVFAKVRERLSVSKQEGKMFHMEGCNLRSLNHLKSENSIRLNFHIGL